VAFPARLLNEGEHVVLSTRTHVKVLLGAVLRLLATAFVAALLITLVGRYVGSDGPRTWVQVALAVLALIVFVALVLRPFLRWYTTTYTFTNRRFIERSGLIARQGRTIPLNRISGVDYEQGVTDRLFGCGTLVVSDASETGTVPLRDIPHIEEAQRVIAEELNRVTSGGRANDDGT
jgi:membrane protein YdbS with pleckstrin-like domain